MEAELTVEGKKPFPVRKFERLEQELRKLRTPGKRTFAVLTRPDGAYIQVGGGRVTCVVEKRNAGSTRNLRARLSSPKVPFKGVTTLPVGGGMVKANPEEFLFIDDVIPLFEAFFTNSETGSDNITWHAMDENFEVRTDVIPT